MQFDPDLEKVYEPIIPSLLSVEREIRKRLSSNYTPPLHRFISRGKRLRPASVLFGAKSFWKNDDGAVLLATSVELIHASSLIHDDIVDEAHFRRDEEAINFKYGNSMAVLIGDYVFTKALLTANELGRTDILHALMDAVINMVEGEFQEEHLSIEERLREETYLEIIAKKTASLFKASFGVGGMWKGWKSTDLKKLFKAGYEFGVAYQIIDDCIDLFNETDGDLTQQKVTLPTIYAIKRKPNLISYLEKGINLVKLKKEIISLGGLFYAFKRAEDYIRMGIQTIANFSDKEVRKTLDNFFLYLRAKKENAKKGIA